MYKMRYTVKIRKSLSIVVFGNWTSTRRRIWSRFGFFASHGRRSELRPSQNEIAANRNKSSGKNSIKHPTNTSILFSKQNGARKTRQCVKVPSRNESVKRRLKVENVKRRLFPPDQGKQGDD